MTFSIDGINIPTTYGVIIAEGSYNGLLEFPQAKEPEANDWAEENGLEVDLSEGVKLKAKEFDIKFVTTGTGDINALLALISDGRIHTYHFSDFDHQWHLRLISGVNYYGSYLGLREITLRFVEDSPVSESQAPVGGRYQSQRYRLDGRNFSEYGIAVLGGTDAEVLKYSANKQGAFIDLSQENGIVYFDEQSNTKHKDVRIKLLLTADNASDFIQNLNALLYDLIKPGHRSLYFADTNKSYSCYYKSSNVEAFYLDSRYWLEFSVVLCVYSFDISLATYLLCTSSKLISSDTSYIKNSGILVFTDENELADISSVFNGETGKMNVSVESNFKTFIITYNNGKITIQ